MFATIIIVLPSSYSGGQIHVSHAAKRDIFDYSSISDHTTTLLGWYTDVVHEVKPITSGFRLALSYNLIHTSRGIPRPVLPSMHAAMAGLRSVLEKWVEGTYVTSSDMIAYLLEHEYSQHNLEMGATKGHDSHKLSHLKEVADALGLALGLANLKHFLSGAADDDGPRHKRGRWDSYEEEEDDGELPGFLEVYESKYELTSLVDLDGHPLFGVNEILLDEDDIIPKDAFKDEGPDDHEYEGYMGNVR